MAEGLEVQLWVWFVTDDFSTPLRVCELCERLTFPAAPPEEQEQTIPYCPACEVWASKMLSVNDFLSDYPKTLPEPLGATLQDKLECLWTLCNTLSREAYHCDDWKIFYHAEWQPIRNAAQEALQIMGWENFRADVDDLTQRCRDALGLNRKFR